MTQLLVYLSLINALTFLLMRADKLAAQKRGRRFRETTLLLFALLGGSFGAMAGMTLFHHKTRHRCFSAGLPFLFLLHTGLLLWCYIH